MNNQYKALIDDIVFVNRLNKQSGFIVLSNQDKDRLAQIFKDHHKEIKEFFKHQHQEVNELSDIISGHTIRSTDVREIYHCLTAKLLDKKIKGKADEFLDPIILKLADDTNFLLHYSIFEKVIQSRHYVRQYLATNFGWLVLILFLLLTLLNHIDGDKFMFIIVNLLFLNYLFYFFTSLYQYRKNMRVIRKDIAQYGSLISSYLIADILKEQKTIINP